MVDVVLSATGLYAPEPTISNEELVTAFNRYVEQFNSQYAEQILNGKKEALHPSSAEFIVKASGIKNRHVIDKEGILNASVMHPLVAERDNEAMSIQCEMAYHATKQALQRAKKTANDIDAIYVACSNVQRAYPAVAIELQHALGCSGYAFDMNVACSSATFGLQTAVAAIQAGQADCVLVVNPEICSAHLNFCDRESHFIFGDACTAMLVEKADNCQSDAAFKIIDCKLQTHFSNNIRNNFGFLNRTAPTTKDADDKLFKQHGRKVFKEVIALDSALVNEQLTELNIQPQQLKRLWLHQANLNMNRLIAERILQREPEQNEWPLILDEYANTSSAGSVIAFHKYHDDFVAGEYGLLNSFGAGYSIGSVVLQKV